MLALRIRYRIIYLCIGCLTSLVCFVYYTFDFGREISSDWPVHHDLILFEMQYRLNGVLIFVPMSVAGLALEWSRTRILWLVCYAAIIPHAIHVGFSTQAVVSNLVFIATPWLIIILVRAQIIWRRTEMASMKEREKERQSYVAQLFKAQEAERKRIAQELHDETCQNLLVIAKDAGTLLTNHHALTLEFLFSKLKSIRELAISTSEEVRRISHDLRPSTLDNLGLEPSLRWLVTRMSHENGIKVRFVEEGAQKKLNPDLELIIFRFVQESLNNIRRHSRASYATVTLQFGSEFIQVIVRDNGAGFNLPEELHELTAQGKLGLIGMQERTESAGGKFFISSSDREGTTVAIRFNL